MKAELIHAMLDSRVAQTAVRDAAGRRELEPAGMKLVRDKKISYTHRYRDQWFRPEYDFDEIAIALDSDSYMMRSFRKKVNRLIVAGHQLVGNNPDTVDYVRRRLREMEWATQHLWDELVVGIFADLFRFNNAMLHKVRDPERSSGLPYMRYGQEIQPIAGMFLLPFETLEFKDQKNGRLKKVQQVMPDGERKEFFPRDLVHFYTNRKPGFSVGTPELGPAIDDIALLRRIEENVEDLIAANLFPMYHYKVGNDNMPERVGPDGVKETDVVKQIIDYMPSGGVYVSDHRHEIDAVGAEGRALRIDFYLTYFKNRALAALGASSLDMGEGDTANRSTASTLSKGMLMDIEALAVTVKRFIEFYIFSELLMEGGWDPLDEENAVHIRFGVIDKEERRADENQQIQLWHANLKTMDEVRAELGMEPWTDEHMERSFYKMYEEPMAMVGGMAPGSAASETLAAAPGSNVTPEAVNKEKQFTEKQVRVAAAAKAKASGGPKKKSSASSGSRKASAAKARPSNQHGTRSAPKSNKDSKHYETVDILGKQYIIACDVQPSAGNISAWKNFVEKRYTDLAGTGISLDTVVYNLTWRLEDANA